MPRPQKKRHVCCEPQNILFTPQNPKIAEASILTVDEYESIRLIDYEGYTQEECSKQMNISRTTVQGIYMSARTKIADALVNSKALRISGGDYVLCQHYGAQCKGACPKQLKKGCNKHCQTKTGWDS